MPEGIALAPRQGCASPGGKGPQPALDPAPGLALATSLKHFSGKRNLAARFARILAAINTGTGRAHAFPADAVTMRRSPGRYGGRGCDPPKNCTWLRCAHRGREPISSRLSNLVENKTSAKSDADVTAWRDGPDRGESHHSRARGDAVPGRRWSWPISRVLSWAAIHLGRRSPVASSSLPAGSADRRCQKTRLPIWPCSGWGLPCRPCCHERGELLPRRFTLA